MRQSIKTAIICMTAAVLAANACSPAKHCTKSELEIPDRIAYERTDSNTIADMKWWELYSDTLLQKLIRNTLENNRDFLAASEKIKELQAKYRIANSALYPSLSAKAGGDHEFYNRGKGFTSEPEAQLSLVIGWEVDFWGTLRWGRKEEFANYLASQEAMRAMQMTLISEVAQAYYELVALDNELAIVKRTLITRQEGVHQAKVRFEGGLTSETSYRQAQVELATTASLIPDLERKIALKESQISLLAGDFPKRIEREKLSLTPTLSDDIPAGIPSELLKRRPDIREAEQKLKAAEAAVGVAQADRFPKLVISLTGGTETEIIENMFKAPIATAVASLTAPIFSFGKKKAAFKASIAAYNQTRLAYENKILQVFKEVNDAVITYRSARENTRLKQNLLEASRKYVELARLQNLNGVTIYLDVLDAQRKYFDAQISMSNAISNEYLAMINLYKALGGGWS